MSDQQKDPFKAFHSHGKSLNGVKPVFHFNQAYLAGLLLQSSWRKWKQRVIYTTAMCINGSNRQDLSGWLSPLLSSIQAFIIRGGGVGSWCESHGECLFPHRSARSIWKERHSIPKRTSRCARATLSPTCEAEETLKCPSCCLPKLCIPLSCPERAPRPDVSLDHFSP